MVGVWLFENSDPVLVLRDKNYFADMWLNWESTEYSEYLDLIPPTKNEKKLAEDLVKW